MPLSRALIVFVGALTFLLALRSPQAVLVLAAGAVLVFGFALLWPPRETPVLMLPFGLQWLSVATKPLLTGVYAVELDTLAERGAALEPAAWFGLGGVAMLAAGMHLGARIGGPNRARALALDAARWPPGLAVWGALAAVAAGHALDMAAPYAGGLRQGFLTLATIKLGGIFILIYWSLSQGRAYAIVGAVCAFELVWGMTGFFSEFKNTLFMALLAAAAARPRLDAGTITLSGALFALTVVVVCFWSVIKPEYRDFLNQGTNTQRVLVPVDDRLDYLADAAMEFDGAQALAGLDATLQRLSYIDFLAHTLDRVPAMMPHEGGTQIGGAVAHVLMPRVLFPDKPPLPHDTYVTAKYTGLSFGQMDYASISIGYLGELYIDFGILPALALAFLTGLGIGKIYDVLMRHDRTPPLANTAISLVAVMPFVAFERALAKFVGGGLMGFFVMLLLQRLVVPRIVTLLSGRQPRRRSRSFRRGRTGGPPARLGGPGPLSD